MKTIIMLLGMSLIASCSQYGEKAYAKRMEEIKEARRQGDITAVEMVALMEDAEARRVYRRPKTSTDPIEESYANRIAAIKESRWRGDIRGDEMAKLMEQAEAQRERERVYATMAGSAAVAGWGALGGFASLAQFLAIL